MTWSEAPKGQIPYSANTTDQYYDMALSFFISDFDDTLFEDALTKSGIIPDEQQSAMIKELKAKAKEESKHPIGYKEYKKIIESPKLALLVYVYKLMNNWIQFAEFLEKVYPDQHIMELFKNLDEAFDGQISTSIVMEKNKTLFRDHCNRYRMQIAQIIEAQQDNGSVAMIISGAQKSLIDSFKAIYINREHTENWQNASSSV